jgi:hypothetical protein
MKITKKSFLALIVHWFIALNALTIDLRISQTSLDFHMEFKK